MIQGKLSPGQESGIPVVDTPAYFEPSLKKCSDVSDPGFVKATVLGNGSNILQNSNRSGQVGRI